MSQEAGPGKEDSETMSADGKVSIRLRRGKRSVDVTAPIDVQAAAEEIAVRVGETPPLVDDSPDVLRHYGRLERRFLTEAARQAYINRPVQPRFKGRDSKASKTMAKHLPAPKVGEVRCPRCEGQRPECPLCESTGIVTSRQAEEWLVWQAQHDA